MLNPSTPGPFASDASIHIVADQVLEACLDDRIPPSLLHIIPEGSGLDLGIRPLDGAHPTELLVGFTAPADWYAIGIAAQGWAYSFAERSRADRARSRVLLVSLVSRSGEMTHVVRTGDPDHPLNTTNEQPSGEQIDLLRRSLGLSTPPPPCDSSVFWAIEWLSALIDRDCDTTCWRDVISLHPASRLLSPDHDAHVESWFPTSARALAKVLPWTRIREIAGSGGVVLPGMSHNDASWFDEGALARFVLNRCPPLSFLRSQAISALRPDLAGRLNETLDSLGLKGPVWPDTAHGSAA